MTVSSSPASTKGMLHSTGTICRASKKPCPLIASGEKHFESQDELVNHLSETYGVAKETLEDSVATGVPLKEVAEMAAEGVYFEEDVAGRKLEPGDGLYYGSYNGPIGPTGIEGSITYPGLSMTPEERLSAIQELTVEGKDIPPMAFVDPSGTIDHEKIKPLSNGMVGGVWLSQSYEGGADWLPVAREYAGRSGGKSSFLTSVTPKEDLKVLRIDSHADLVRVIAIYPIEEGANSFTEVDYERLRDEGGYGGVWLTRKGWRETNGRSSNSSSDDHKIDHVNSRGKTPALTIFSADGLDGIAEPELVNKDTVEATITGSKTLLRLGRKQDAKRYVSFNNYLKRQSLLMLQKQILKFEGYAAKNALGEKDKEILLKLKNAYSVRTAAKAASK